MQVNGGENFIRRPQYHGPGWRLAACGGAGGQGLGGGRSAVGILHIGPRHSWKLTLSLFFYPTSLQSIVPRDLKREMRGDDAWRLMLQDRAVEWPGVPKGDTWM